MTQKRPSEFLLTESGIQHDVPRRTVSGIRLSDKTSCFRPREGLRQVAQADQAQHVVQILIGEP